MILYIMWCWFVNMLWFRHYMLWFRYYMLWVCHYMLWFCHYTLFLYDNSSLLWSLFFIMMIILYYDEVKFPVLQYPYVCICRCAYRIPQTILIHFFSWNNAHFELRNLTKNERYHWNSLSAQLHRSRSTEFPETLYM